MADSLTSPDAHIPHGGEDGDNSPLGGRNEPVQEPQHGTDDYSSGRLQHDGTSCMLNPQSIVERFLEHPTMRMSGAGTRRSYSTVFKRFAKEVELHKYTRRQLSGPQGKRLILEYINGIPLRSRQVNLCGLAKVWKLTLDLPWPIDVQRDVGRLPKVRRKAVPPDSVIREWNERLHDEPNPYLRCIWLIVGNSGNRPNTVVRLRWHHVRHNEQGVPIEVRLNGADERTKRDADVAWALPSEVAEALVELRKMLPESGENDPILPWMDGWGDIQPHRQMLEEHLRYHWNRLRAKYSLPKLTMCDVRHWVSARCKDCRLEEQARAFMMGHEQPIHDMGDLYDNRSVETNLARQSARLPHGPLGIFLEVKAEIVNEIPNELIAALLDYRDGRVKSTEMLDRLETWRVQSSSEPARVPL